MGLTDDPEIAGDSSHSSDAEVTAFLAEKNINRESSPFTWRKAHEEHYLLVAAVARKYLSAPMGSIASEREFKIAKRVTQGRYNLKPRNVQKLLFLKYNLRMLNCSV